MKKLKLDLMHWGRYGGQGWYQIMARDHFRVVVFFGISVLVLVELLLIKSLFIPSISEVINRRNSKSMSSLHQAMIEPDGTRIVGEVAGVENTPAETGQVQGISTQITLMTITQEITSGTGYLVKYVLTLGGF